MEQPSWFSEARVVAELDARLVADIDTSALSSPVVVYNSLSWERSEWLQIGFCRIRGTKKYIRPQPIGVT